MRSTQQDDDDDDADEAEDESLCPPRFVFMVQTDRQTVIQLVD